uniref:Uncharacterized protein n=1 Tax=Setaria viridis TaxID=4556 RepID=A0A4U6UE03_SETVI|nr:hypothetical protein SEVIR_5G102000v2 [Setaria viridis]
MRGGSELSHETFVSPSAGPDNRMDLVRDQSNNQKNCPWIHRCREQWDS